MATRGTLFRQDAGAAASCTVNVTGVVAGDFLLAIIMFDSGPFGTISPPSGWTSVLPGEGTDGSNIRYRYFYKLEATGSETNEVWTINASATGSLGYVVNYHKNAARTHVAGVGGGNATPLGTTDPWTFSFGGASAPAAGWQRSTIVLNWTDASINIPTTQRAIPYDYEPSGPLTLATSWAKVNWLGQPSFDFDFATFEALNQTAGYADPVLTWDMFPSGAPAVAQAHLLNVFIDEDLNPIPPSVGGGSLVGKSRRSQYQNMPYEVTEAMLRRR